ncbi:arsenite efflux transporter metallochaperone ArsD [Serinibacter salmoneus]|uniref:Arsenical resistance operon trans-acting repressor ArsD n=1 Tax=Serinibacter salmoneus TaxID=556530 RepID=A0A2A9D1G8_9MICO|nr:arsenite efflux transporter metallochaperone ArsD [Serinibacter salmoneus]PFG20493.1 arsenical resistance operon trans-acting repressor ArsD [Serinibacter salmoneus]
MSIQVFEGPLCCNTGVCGTDPDQALIDFTADLAWLSSQGVAVRRANLAQDPAVFAENPIARAFVQKVGAQGLPLIVVDDVTVVTGRYPGRDELARIAGLETAAAASVTAPTGETDSGCCGSDEPAGQAESGCCGGAQPVTITTRVQD